MEDDQLEKLRYPVGRFMAPHEYSKENMEMWIREVDELPSQCRNALQGFTEEMLADTYRPGGWTARQVIHHLVDSHMNAYIRFKLTLTEDVPVIRPYLESLWAELNDSKNAPPEYSLTLLEALHRRWILVINNISEIEFSRCYFHPESKKEFMLKTALALYAWHGKHHLEHIRIVKRKFVGIKA